MYVFIPCNGVTHTGVPAIVILYSSSRSPSEMSQGKPMMVPTRHSSANPNTASQVTLGVSSLTSLTTTFTDATASLVLHREEMKEKRMAVMAGY